MGDNERNTQTVLDFYRTAFNDKQPTEAVARQASRQRTRREPIAA